MAPLLSQRILRPLLAPLPLLNLLHHNQSHPHDTPINPIRIHNHHHTPALSAIPDLATQHLTWGRKVTFEKQARIEDLGSVISDNVGVSFLQCIVGSIIDDKIPLRVIY